MPGCAPLYQAQLKDVNAAFDSTGSGEDGRKDVFELIDFLTSESSSRASGTL